MGTSILLPGLEKQFEFVQKLEPLAGKRVLIYGGDAALALRFAQAECDVDIIVPDYERLTELRLSLLEHPAVRIKMMDFAHTDFPDETFDLLYAQGSVSLSDRSGIVKEARRILKDKANFCVGEIVLIKPNPPKYLTDIWSSVFMQVLPIEEVDAYYTSRSFTVLARVDYLKTVKQYYTAVLAHIKEMKNEPDSEDTDNKAISRLNHEAAAFVKFGGDKYAGFRVLFLRKNA